MDGIFRLFKCYTNFIFVTKIMYIFFHFFNSDIGNVHDRMTYILEDSLVVAIEKLPFLYELF